MYKAIERFPHQSVRMTQGFWKEQLDKIRTVTVWDVLNKFEHDHEEGIMKNYEWVAEGQSGIGKHIGPPWYDGLICETIRGISDIIAVTGDEKLKAKIDYYADKIEAAQDVDPHGYINTYTTLICPNQRWGEQGGSIIWQHETYNIGCLVEAGVHYYRATGELKLLKCAVKAANCMCGVMGEAPKKNIVPAHSLGEEAMVKLHQLFIQEPALVDTLAAKYGVTATPADYLALVRFWMDHRGVHHNRAALPKYMGEYSQDHLPITMQSEAVGHAVRAALMYTGLAALGVATHDHKYIDAATRIWDNVEQTKLHISGGIGAVHNEERFGYQYDLPNNAYLETCAGVALAFWAGEMHRIYGEGRFMDVLETALYNNILPGLSADGVHYFYENPLVDEGKAQRWSWHGCPCCPPMFLKMMGSLQDYIYSCTDDALYVNLHMGSSLTATMHGVALTVEQKGCGLPWSGENSIVVNPATPVEFALKVRIPAWAGDTALLLNGQPVTQPVENGYLTMQRRWQAGDTLSLTMSLPVIKVEAHPYVDADIGRIAIQRGPVLYCLEQHDNPDVQVVLGQDPLTITEGELFGKAVFIDGKTAQGQSLRAIPYYLWNNRGKNSMAVWLRQLDKGQADAIVVGNSDFGDFAAHKAVVASTRKTDLTGWEGKLYRAYK